MATGIRKRTIGGREVYEINFYDQLGVRRFEVVGPSLRRAKRLRTKRLAEVKAGTYDHGRPRASMTLDELAERWRRDRAREGMRSLDDAMGCYHNHVSPALGSTRLEDLTPKRVAALVSDLTRTRLAAKTVRNVHGALHSILELARFEELIVSNPASLPRGKLPAVGKKKRPRFSREEVWQLVTDPAIAGHRRVFYALMGLGGLRLGEASGRRWRDLDTETPGLAAMMVDTQYDGAPLKTDDGEDTRERIVPVHPALAEVLSWWRCEGFPALFGRHPTSEDWLAPDPKTGAPRTQNQAVKALYRDLDRLGIPRKVGGSRRGRACHAFRHAFVSLARSDGARRDVLERVTHNARGDVLDGYTDWEWTAMCEAVSCLRLDLGRADVVALDGGGNGGATSSESLFSHGGGGSRTSRREGEVVPSGRFLRLRQSAWHDQKQGKSGSPVPVVASATTLARAAQLLEDSGHHEEAAAVRALTRGAVGTASVGGER